jgi:tripartite-type tricarboxylate transporter receptor subunit TctC
MLRFECIGSLVKLVLISSAVWTVMACFGGQAAAQAWPQKPVKMLIGFAPGGPADIAVRVISQGISPGLGQPVIVENRPGAGASVAMELVAKAPPDGYTMTLGSPGSLFFSKGLFPEAAYDPLTSFAPVGLFGKSSFMLVSHPSLGVQTLKDFVALAKSRSGTLNYGAATPGTPPHVLAEMFKSQAGVQMVGVHYRGSADAVTGFLAGDTQMLVDSYSVLGSLVASKKAVPLLVTSSARNKMLPDVPTAAEAGMPEFAVETWFSIVAPAGTAAAAIRRVNAEIAKAVTQKEVIASMAKLDLEPASSTPEELGAMIKRDWPKWHAAVKASGAKGK